MREKGGSKNPTLRPRFRVVCGKTIALGPGKVELLRSLAHTGSLNQAARELGMSYMRAWTLIKTMNKSFRQPLVVAARGGKTGGGMRITEAGRRVLALYQEIEASALKSTHKQWRALQVFLRH